MFNETMKPMLLKEVEKPFQDSNYLYELKYDGIRALIYVSKEKIKIITRNGKNVTKIYPELKEIQKLVKNHEIILDGEIVAFQDNLPSFSALQQRSHLKNNQKIKDMMEEIPICFIAFDIIYQDKSLIDMPLIKRKKILEQYPDKDYFIKTKTYENGLQLFKKVKKLGLEGIVAKEKSSIYLPNTRVDFWLKIKNFKVEEFLVHGYIKLEEKYSLLLGELKRNKLYYVGKVSVIAKHPLLKDILKAKKVKNQFINENIRATYIEPIYKIKVHYMERTKNNTLRQPFIRK